MVEACDNLGKERAGRLRCVVDGGDVVPWWVEGEEEGCRERRQLEKEHQQVSEEVFYLLFASLCRFSGEETSATMWRDVVPWLNAGPHLSSSYRLNWTSASSPPTPAIFRWRASLSLSPGEVASSLWQKLGHSRVPFPCLSQTAQPAGSCSLVTGTRLLRCLAARRRRSLWGRWWDPG